MYKIVISHPLYKDGMDALEGKGELIIPNNGDSDAIIDKLKAADAFILRIGKIDRKAIEQCPNLKVITRPGVGYDNVDVKCATERGIPVVICPSSNYRAVAEHTIALMFAIGKNLVESVVEQSKGNYNIRNKFKAVDLKGKTISVLGFGQIGKEVARLCKAFDMNVLIYDPFVSKDVAEKLGYSYATELNSAVAQGDFITLHMPSIPETRGLIGKKQFAAMKPSAYFINAARGDIVDEQAMFETLKNEKIAGAALDVLSLDPPKSDNPILKLPNVIVTPHMAAQTKETASLLAMMAVEGTLAVLNGEKWPHVADKGVYEHPRWN